MATKDPFDVVALPVNTESDAVPKVKIKEYKTFKDRDGNDVEISTGLDRNVTLAELQRQAANLSAKLAVVQKQIAAATIILNASAEVTPELIG